MGFHMISLLKRSVWLKILYIQKSDELFLATVECSHWWKIYFYKKILYKRKSCKGFFCKNKFSTNESTGFITGHMVYNLAYTQILQTTTTIVPVIDIQFE